MMLNDTGKDIPPIESILFDSTKTVSWLRRISEAQSDIRKGRYDHKRVTVCLSYDISVNDLGPVHLVTFACLIRSLRQRGVSGSIQASSEVISFFVEDLHLDRYFSSETPHVTGGSQYNLNLWRVLSHHFIMYSQHVADYLRRRYFNGKDLSGLKVVLDELYANIADHSESEGLAYSFIKYDEEKEIIKIAFCDFGIGIKASMAKSGLVLETDYIRQATAKGVTSKSNSHNKGLGLDIVVSSVCGSGKVIRILSGTELFVSYGDGENDRTWNIDFDFSGTLIYFDIPISSFDDVDYIDEFEL